MKSCPTCGRTYADASQQFCLQDGTPLVAGGAPVGAQAGAGPSWQPPPAKKKRAIWPWVLGGLALLVVGGVVLLIGVGIVAYKLADKNTNSVVRTNSNARSSVNTSAITPPAEDDVDTADTELYVNSRDRFTGTLATNYIDFSFRYPNTWKLDPDPAPSFVRLERSNAQGNTIENFSVGWLATTGGSARGNTALLSNAINNLSNQISGNFPNYTKVAEGNTTLGRYQGYELRFTGAAQKGTSSELPFWGRIVIIPNPDGGTTGASIIMLATGHSSEVKGQADLGEKGELPLLIKTFELGPPPPPAPDSSTNSNTDDEN